MFSSGDTGQFRIGVVPGHCFCFLLEVSLPFCCLWPYQSSVKWWGNSRSSKRGSAGIKEALSSTPAWKHHHLAAFSEAKGLQVHSKVSVLSVISALLLVVKNSVHNRNKAFSFFMYFKGRWVKWLSWKWKSWRKGSKAADQKNKQTETASLYLRYALLHTLLQPKRISRIKLFFFIRDKNEISACRLHS